MAIMTTYPLIILKRQTRCRKGDDFLRGILFTWFVHKLVFTRNHYLSPNQLATSRLLTRRWPCKIMQRIDDRTMSRRTRGQIYERDVFDL